MARPCVVTRYAHSVVWSSPSKSVQSNARAMRDVVPTTCLIHNGISVSRATPLLLRSRSTCFTPLLLSIPTRRAYARPIAAMLATEAFSTPAANGVQALGPAPRDDAQFPAQIDHLHVELHVKNEGIFQLRNHWQTSLP